MLTFTNLLNAKSVDDISVNSVLIDQVDLDEDLSNQVKSIEKHFVKLENGAEGYLYKLGGEYLEKSDTANKEGKLPMITLIHGGPFSASPQDMFLLQRLFLVMQGYLVLVVNYRGTIGFGNKFMNSLLGHIGDRDV